MNFYRILNKERKLNQVKKYGLVFHSKIFIEYTKIINYIPDKITITEFLLIKIFTLVGIKSTELIFICLLFILLYNMSIRIEKLKKPD